MKSVRIWSFSSPYFPTFRWIRTRKTPNTDTSLAVCGNRAYASDHYFLIKSWIFSSCLFSIKKHPCRGAFKNKCSEGLKNSKYLWKNSLLAKFQTFHLQFYQKEPHHRYFWETSWVTVWEQKPLFNRFCQTYMHIWLNVWLTGEDIVPHNKYSLWKC